MARTVLHGSQRCFWIQDSKVARRAQSYGQTEQFDFPVSQTRGIQPGDEDKYLQFVCRLQKTAEDYVEVELLRPKEWVLGQKIEPGSTYYLDMPEQGAQGEAQVLAVLPCPSIEAGLGPLPPIYSTPEQINSVILVLQPAEIAKKLSLPLDYGS